MLISKQQVLGAQQPIPKGESLDQGGEVLTLTGLPVFYPRNEIELAIANLPLGHKVILGSFHACTLANTRTFLLPEVPGLHTEHVKISRNSHGELLLGHYDLESTAVIVTDKGSPSEQIISAPENFTPITLRPGHVVKIADVEIRICCPTSQQRHVPSKVPAAIARSFESRLKELNLQVGESVTIGRGDVNNSNFISVANPFINREHAQLTYLGNYYYRISDLNSTNGTFVHFDGIIREAGIGTVVGPGDRILLGSEVELTIPIEIGPLDEQRIAGVSKTLHELRKGRPGDIRSDTELSSGDVARLLYDQLMVVTPSAVDEVIESFDLQSRLRARTTLAIASQYASMDALQAIYQGYRHAASMVQDDRLFVPAAHTLAANLIYLSSNKGCFTSRCEPLPDIESSTHITPNVLAILEQSLLEQLERSPEMARSLNIHQTQLLLPGGFETGINPFNATTLQEITDHTRRLMCAAADHQSHHDCSFDQAVQIILQEPLLKRLAEIETRAQLPAGSLASLTTVIKSPRELAGTQEDFSSETIAKQLNGRAGLSTSELDRALKQLHQGYHAMTRELIAQLSEAYSARSMTRILRNHHQRIQNTAIRNDIPIDRIFYLVPEAYKSFGMVTLAYTIANEVPPDQLLDDFTEIEKRGLDQNSMVVVLDDVAGSGNSLRRVWDTFLKSGFKGHVGLCPILSTRIALAGDGRSNQAKKDFIELMREHRQLHYLPARVTTQVSRTKFMTHLDVETRSVIKKLLGDQGWGNSGLVSAFPYITPDNNCQIWTELGLAQHFTLSERCVKYNSSDKYNAPSADDLENQLNSETLSYTSAYQHLLGKPKLQSWELRNLLGYCQKLSSVTQLQKRLGFQSSTTLGSLLAHASEKILSDAKTEMEHFLVVLRRELSKEDLDDYYKDYMSARNLLACLSDLQQFGVDIQDFAPIIQGTLEPLRSKLAKEVAASARQLLVDVSAKDALSLRETAISYAAFERVDRYAKDVGLRLELLESLDQSEEKVRTLAADARVRAFRDLEDIWSRRNNGLTQDEIYALTAGLKQLDDLSGDVALTSAERRQRDKLHEGVVGYQKWTVAIESLQRKLKGAPSDLDDILSIHREMIAATWLISSCNCDPGPILHELSREIFERAKAWSTTHRKDWYKIRVDLLSLEDLRNYYIRSEFDVGSRYDGLIAEVATAGYQGLRDQIRNDLDIPGGIDPATFHSWQDLIDDLETISQRFARNASLYCRKDMAQLTELMFEGALTYISRMEAGNSDSVRVWSEKIRIAQSKASYRGILPSDTCERFDQLLTTKMLGSSSTTRDLRTSTPVIRELLGPIISDAAVANEEPTSARPSISTASGEDDI